MVDPASAIPHKRTIRTPQTHTAPPNKVEGLVGSFPVVVRVHAGAFVTGGVPAAGEDDGYDFAVSEQLHAAR